MKNSLLQLAFGIAFLVVGAGIEELLPKFGGVGFPVLLMSVCSFATRRQGGSPLVLALAMAAGGLEDAVCSLPPMTSSSFFLAVAIVVRWVGALGMMSALAYPCYQLWLLFWVDGLGHGIFWRLLLALPFGVLTACCVFAVVGLVGERMALDEEE